MSSSIDRAGGGAMPRGWRLQDIPSDELAALLKISRKEVAARRKALLQQQTDPAWIAAALDGLPAATLALLHVLIEAGGLAMEDALVRAARERFGMSANDCRVASGPAIARVLMVPLRTQASEIAFGVVLPAATLIAPLVAHLDLHDLPSAPFVASESPARNPRLFLAACVASRHLDVKLTLEGRTHRGSVKRLARQVGLDEASLEAMLGTGLALGMLRLEGELLRPDIEALAGAAMGHYPGSAALAALQAQLTDGPVATEAIVRSLQRRFDWEDQRFLTADVLGYLPGFEAGTVDGVPAVARRASEGVAAGHVTPSFEVFLPPDARLVDIVHAGACCAWERLDRVLVGRITKASIARAVTGGASAGQLVEELAAASRHPIPQNVEAAIRDWAGSVVSATIATGRVIVVDPGVHARVAPALARHAPRELAPGVFVIGERADLREIGLALTRAGIYHREVSAVRAPPRPFGPEPAFSTPGSTPEASRIRARVTAWRRGESFEGVRDDFLDKHRATRPEPPAISTTGKPAELRSIPALRWQRGDLRERLQEAALCSETLALQLASGVRYIEITETMRRGSIWMVLGEDLVNDDAVALRLDDIQAIATLPDDFELDVEDELALAGNDEDDGEDDDEAFDRKPWRPARGQPAPPGHVPCPCGSGVRYRHCCRDRASA